MRVGVSPPLDSASATRSKANAEIKTPAPNAITLATTGRGTSTNQAISAPTTRAPPARTPHSPACTQIGIVDSFGAHLRRLSQRTSREPVARQEVLAHEHSCV